MLYYDLLLRLLVLTEALKGSIILIHERAERFFSFFRRHGRSLPVLILCVFLCHIFFAKSITGCLLLLVSAISVELLVFKQFRAVFENAVRFFLLNSTI